MVCFDYVYSSSADNEGSTVDGNDNGNVYITMVCFDYVYSRADNDNDDDGDDFYFILFQLRLAPRTTSGRHRRRDVVRFGSSNDNGNQ